MIWHIYSEDNSLASRGSVVFWELLIFKRRLLVHEVNTSNTKPQRETSIQNKFYLICIMGIKPVVVFFAKTKSHIDQHLCFHYKDSMSRDVRKPDFCICKNKDADQLLGNLEAVSAFVFAKRIVWYLYFLNLKFQVPCHLLWLHSPVCVGPGREPQRRVFLIRRSFSLSTS